MRTQGIQLTDSIHLLQYPILQMALRSTGNNCNKQSLEYFEFRGRYDKSGLEGRHECILNLSADT